MADGNTESTLFRAFYNAVAESSDERAAQTQYFKAGIQAELSDLDPIAAQELLQTRLREISADTELLTLFDSIHGFQMAAVGEPYHFDDHHHFVVATAAIARRITGRQEVGSNDFPLLLEKLETALEGRAKAGILQDYLHRNAGQLSEYRLRLLEQGAMNPSQATKPQRSDSPEAFTHARQAIALHYLLQEALGIANVDTTRLMEFAHLLAAKSIPINKETGKENIRNSGIKSAFNKAWKKEDANHLADLRFVLRFLKPLAVEGAVGMQQAVTALEKRIVRISEKLSKSKD